MMELRSIVEFANVVQRGCQHKEESWNDVRQSARGMRGEERVELNHLWRPGGRRIHEGYETPDYDGHGDHDANPEAGAKPERDAPCEGSGGCNGLESFRH